MKPGRYAVTVRGPARRDLSSLPLEVTAAVLELLSGDLAVAPRRVGKPLTGDLDGRWAARRGEYRVIYEIDDAAALVRVVRVGHRRDVYRRR